MNHGIPFSIQFFNPKLFTTFNLNLYTVLTILMVFFSEWKFMSKHSLYVTYIGAPKNIRMVDSSVKINYLANAPDTSKFSTGSLTDYLVFPL